MARRRFDRAFKISAVKLTLEDNLSVSEALKELSIYYNPLYVGYVNIKNPPALGIYILGG